MAQVYSLKEFNPEVFQAYVNKVPKTRLNALLTSGAIKTNQNIVSRLRDQVGGHVVVEPIMGRLGGTADNYDGNTDITTDSRSTYLQRKIVVGRAHSWGEYDFAYDITGGVDFLATAQEVAEYFQDVDEDTLLAMLEGIFAMTTTAGKAFAEEHTLTLTTEVTATSLNDAAQKALGDMKGNLSLAIMHSKVANTLENLQVLDYWKQTDANGVTRPTAIASWNGRTVLITDNVPTASSDGTTTYTTYLFGAGAIEYADCGVRVPFETDRSPLTKGGHEVIVGRQRHLFAPVGISWAGADTIISPTVAQLKTGSNWKVAPNADGSGAYPSKGIAIGRILSIG